MSTVLTVIFCIISLYPVGIGVLGIATAWLSKRPVKVSATLDDVWSIVAGVILICVWRHGIILMRTGRQPALLIAALTILICGVLAIVYGVRAIKKPESGTPVSSYERGKRFCLAATFAGVAVLTVLTMVVPALGSKDNANQDASEVKAAESDLTEDSATTEELESSFVPVDLNGMTENEYLEENWGKYLNLPQISESMSSKDSERLAQTEDKYDLPLEFKYEKDLNKEEEAKDETYESLFGNAYASFQLAEGWGMHPEIVEALPELKSYLDVINSAYSEYRDTTTREVVKKGAEGARRLGAEYFLTENSKEEVVHTKEFQKFTAAMAEVIKHSEYKGVQKRQTKVIFGLPYKGQDDNSLRRAIARTKPEEQVTREVLVFITTLPNGSQLEWGLAKWSKDYCEFPEPSSGEKITTNIVERNPPNIVEEEPPVGGNPPTTSTPDNPSNPSTPVEPNPPVEPDNPVQPNPDTKQTGEVKIPDQHGNAATGGGDQPADLPHGDTTGAQNYTDTIQSNSQNNEDQGQNSTSTSGGSNGTNIATPSENVGTSGNTGNPNSSNPAIVDPKNGVTFDGNPMNNDEINVVAPMDASESSNAASAASESATKTTTDIATKTAEPAIED